MISGVRGRGYVLSAPNHWPMCRCSTQLDRRTIPLTPISDETGKQLKSCSGMRPHSRSLGMLPQLRTWTQWSCCGRHGLVGVTGRSSISRLSTSLISRSCTITGRHLRQHITTCSRKHSNNPGLHVGHGDRVSRLCIPRRRAYPVKTFRCRPRIVLRLYKHSWWRLLNMRIGLHDIGAEL